MPTDTENEEVSEIPDRTNEQYNQWPRPKHRVQFAMAQTNKQSITFPKTYAIIMITQFNIKDGLKAYSNKGDEAILKEVKQLHTQQTLMPWSRHEMSYDQRK